MYYCIRVLCRPPARNSTNTDLRIAPVAIQVIAAMLGLCPRAMPRRWQCPTGKAQDGAVGREDAQSQLAAAALADLLSSIPSEAKGTAELAGGVGSQQPPGPALEPTLEQYASASSSSQLQVDTPKTATAQSAALQPHNVSAFRPYWAAACQHRPSLPATACSPWVLPPLCLASAAASFLPLARSSSLQPQRLVPPTPAPATSQPTPVLEAPTHFPAKRKYGELASHAGSPVKQRKLTGPSRLQLAWAMQVYVDHYNMRKRGHEGPKDAALLSTALAILKAQLLCSYIGQA
jgi:hypothetical protein